MPPASARRAATGAKAKAQPPAKKRVKREPRSSEDESDAVSLHSDDLDEDEPRKPTKRKAASKKGTPKTRKKRKRDHSEESDLSLEEGQTVVGKIVKAPKEGQVPPGRISQNTLDFLTQLRQPDCNDRQWFKLHDPVYRQAEKEWVEFINKFTETLRQVDAQIPPLPGKDVIHRLYRDVRFSNDKTPYKTNFSASFSRSGRKGPFAGYHVSGPIVSPGGGSFIAAGTWCPGKDELATLRHNITSDSSNLRTILSEPVFAKLFGEPRPGSRTSIFGRDDQLKVAPKGINKDHPDIDLLKCRSFAVAHKLRTSLRDRNHAEKTNRFTDAQVLDPEFMEILSTVLTVVQPFVHCLNDMMSIMPASDSD